eukprot:3809404-Amphidinium_carterae.1
MAWIYNGRCPGVWNLYGPAVATIQEALEEINMNVTIMDGRASCQLITEARNVIQQGLLAFVVAIGWMNVPQHSKSPTLNGVCGYKTSLKRIADMGAYIVVYNTEPDPRYWMDAPVFAKKMGAREIWTYSHANLKYYQDAAARADLVARYFPAGCAKALDVRVDLNSPRRQVERVGFAGRRPYGVRWVDSDKSPNPETPDLRSRLVVQETRGNSSIAVGD